MKALRNVGKVVLGIVLAFIVLLAANFFYGFLGGIFGWSPTGVAKNIILLGLAVGAFLYFRHRRKIAASTDAKLARAWKK